MNSVIVSCARFRLHLHRSSCTWASASADIPPEVHSLQETVSALHQLLDSAVKADADESHSHSKLDRATDELSIDLTAAERLMQHLEKVLEDVLFPAQYTKAAAGPSRDSQLPSLITRWSSQREKFLKLHAELKDRQYRILADLARLNAVYDPCCFTKRVTVPLLTILCNI